jgi:2-polyprenyl-6-hydroxyphenyl methylase/3-demethylubiquinone-9 3-methyltransferase
VTGVDPSATNIEVAKLHAAKSGLEIDYRRTTIEDMPDDKFDIVLAMEVVEHVVSVGAFLDRCAALMKPDGLMLVSTLNRTWKSFALAIVGAEYVLRWLPRGTHEWRKFVTPGEVAEALREPGLAITHVTGVSYNPVLDVWKLGRDLDVNYMAFAVKA